MKSFISNMPNEVNTINQLYEHCIGLKYSVARIDDYSFNYVKDKQLHSIILDKLNKEITDTIIGTLIAQEEIESRRKSLSEALALNALDGVPPTKEDLLIYQEYIEGILSFNQMEEKRIQKYRR